MVNHSPTKEVRRDLPRSLPSAQLRADLDSDFRTSISLHTDQPISRNSLVRLYTLWSNLYLSIRLVQTDPQHPAFARTASEFDGHLQRNQLMAIRAIAVYRLGINLSMDHLIAASPCS
jgi:hypothetical protein